MGNKAVSKAVIQLALVIGLVLAANAIKPFSPSNLVLHTLSSARSLSFVLPGAAAEKIDHATHLAQTLGKGLLDGDRSDSIWNQESGVKSDLLASNASFDGAEIKDVKPGEPAKKSSSPKRSLRRAKSDSRENSDEVAASEKNADRIERQIAALPVISPAISVDSIAMAEPVRLPVFKPTPTKAMFFLPALPAKLNSCKTIEVKEVKLIALIQQSQQAPKLKVDLLATQPTKISLQCREEERVITEETEAAEGAATSAGPEEEFFFNQTTTGPFGASPQPECRNFR